jgi:hypothetical protein
MSRDKFKCVHIPCMWELVDAEFDNRPGWIMSMCKHCGQFIGWRTCPTRQSQPDAHGKKERSGSPRGV